MKSGQLLHVHDRASAARSVEVRVADAARAAERHPEAARDGDRLRFPISSDDDIAAVVRTLVEGGARIYEVRVRGEELEDLYLRLVEGRA
jgi:hypothetical protein